MQEEKNRKRMLDNAVSMHLLLRQHSEAFFLRVLDNFREKIVWNFAPTIDRIVTNLGNKNEVSTLIAETMGEIKKIVYWVREFDEANRGSHCINAEQIEVYIVNFFIKEFVATFSNFKVATVRNLMGEIALHLQSMNFPAKEVSRVESELQSNLHLAN